MANTFRNQFTVTPQVLKVSEEEKRIIIHARQGHGRKLLDMVSSYRLVAMYQPVPGENRKWLKTLPEGKLKRLPNGDLELYARLPKEGEYTLYLEKAAGEGDAAEVMTFAVYALEKDLFNLRPWKGDFHIHSSESDGKETPEFVMATCRRDGFDFMALTDHHQYAPSLVAQKAACECNCDMLVLPGEEVHLPGNAPHIINFGGNRSINELACRDEEKYRRESMEYAKALPENMDSINRFEIGASEWAFDRIREAGGVAMFCHPYWHWQYHNYVDEEVIDHLLDHNRFDVLEVFGGMSKQQIEMNMLAMHRWQEERAKGKIIPAAGVSDGHGCDTSVSNWYYTVIFAEKLEFPLLAEAIRADRCVGVHRLPGEHPLLAGNFRLCKFTYFLFREFYPRHDEICHLEGTIMRSYYSEGSINAPEVISSLSGAVASFMRSFWEEN